MKMRNILLIVGLIVCQTTLTMGQAKWIQPPDDTPTGIDIRIDREDGIARVIADDFECVLTGPITGVHFWGSWLKDAKGNIIKIHLSIHDDIPADPADPDSYSKPGDLRWQMDFYPGEFNEIMVIQLPPGESEWWWDAYSAAVAPDPAGDTQI